MPVNLIFAGFYATTKRRQAEEDGAYEPSIAASTRDLGHSVEIAIRYNATWAADDVRAKTFTSFFTTIEPSSEPGAFIGAPL